MDPVIVGGTNEAVNQSQFGTPDSSKGINPNIEYQNKVADEQTEELKAEKVEAQRKESLKGNSINTIA